MPVTIAVQDAQTNRDVIITIAGLGALETCQVFYSKTNEDATTAWTALETFTANGSYTRELPSNGYYWFYGLLASGITNLARSIVTSGDVPWEQIIDTVIARIQDSINAGGFPRITDPARVVAAYSYIPAVFTSNVPGIAVIGNGRIVPYVGNNEEEDKGYPVLIVCADRGTENTPRRGDDPYLTWNARLNDLFDHKRMPGVTKDGIDIVYDVDVTYPDAVQYISNTFYDVRVAVQLTVKTREARNP